MIISNNIIREMERIGIEFGFAEDIDHQDIALKTVNFINNSRREILNYPRRIEVKEQLTEYVKHAKILLTTIKSLPDDIKEKYDTYYKPMSDYHVINPEYLKIEEFHDIIKAFKDMGVNIYPVHIDPINAMLQLKAEIAVQVSGLLNCFNKGACDINIKINTMLRIKKISVKDSTLLSYIESSLNELITICEYMIEYIKKDGRPSNPLTTNAIIWLAHLYETHSIKSRKARTYSYTDKTTNTWYYRGEFFNFILRCRVFLRMLGINMSNNIATIGDLTCSALEDYRILTGRKAVKPKENKKMLEIDHLMHLLDIYEMDF